MHIEQNQTVKMQIKSYFVWKPFMGLNKFQPFINKNSNTRKYDFQMAEVTTDVPKDCITESCITRATIMQPKL